MTVYNDPKYKIRIPDVPIQSYKPAGDKYQILLPLIVTNPIRMLIHRLMVQAILLFC